MKLYTSFLSIGILLGGIYFSLSPEEGLSVSSSSRSAITRVNDIDKSVEVFNFTAGINGDKVDLQWKVNGNDEINQFEIEKSTDGKNFKTAALVFGTDNPGTDNYMYYEKATDQKIQYRIKVIDKKGSGFYSQTIEVTPAQMNESRDYQAHL